MRYQLTEDEQNVIDEGLTFLEGRDYPLAAGLLRRIVKRACPTWEPDWASPPGATIKMMLEDRFPGEDPVEVLEYKVVNLTGVEAELLLKGRATIDEPLAERLAEGLGTSKHFWLERELDYRTALVRLDPAYAPQDIVVECLERLGAALGGPPPGQANTLWGMVKTVCEARGRREKLLQDLSYHREPQKSLLERIEKELGDEA